MKRIIYLDLVDTQRILSDWAQAQGYVGKDECVREIKTILGDAGGLKEVQITVYQVPPTPRDPRD